MPTPIVMPQMGESVAEGTIVRWIKKVGDQVDRDEPLFEITTDKVDAEIPSPAAGILTEITAKEGDTVSVNSVVGTIQVAGDEPPRRLAEASGEGGPASTTAAEPAPSPRVGAAKAAASTQPQADGTPTAPKVTPPDNGQRQKSSPLVRRIAR